MTPTTTTTTTRNIESFTNDLLRILNTPTTDSIKKMQIIAALLSNQLSSRDPILVNSLTRDNTETLSFLPFLPTPEHTPRFLFDIINIEINNRTLATDQWKQQLRLFPDDIRNKFREVVDVEGFLFPQHHKSLLLDLVNPND